MVVSGVNIAFDYEGNDLSTDRAGSMEQIFLDVSRRQGIDMPRYIRPAGQAGVHGLSRPLPTAGRNDPFL
ncbi:MAG: hypothetical protein P8Y48_04415 [Novosphingobium sp.]